MYRKTVLALSLAGAGAALAACSTATPQTAAQFAPKPVVTGAQPVADVKPVMANSGTYPTFGQPMTAANKQMEDSEATRLQAQMSALTASRNAGTVTEAEYQKQLAELRKLAATHGTDMQAKIAN
ncbi:hypothetical protein ACFFHG_02165 [Gellertiella hungarica]